MSTSIFHAVTGDFRCTQVTFNFVCQLNHCAFSFNRFHCTCNNCTFVVHCSEVGEWITFQLFYAQRNALTFNVDCQNNRFQLITFFELANSFFASSSVMCQPLV